MHQIHFLLGLLSRPHWGSYSAPPGPLAVFKGPTSNRREGEEQGRGGGRDLAHPKNFGMAPL